MTWIKRTLVALTITAGLLGTSGQAMASGSADSIVGSHPDKLCSRITLWDTTPVFCMPMI